MKPDNSLPHWNQLGDQAADRLSIGFSQSVLQRVGEVRAHRRQLAAMSATLAVCLLCTAVATAWNGHQQSEQNLTDWQTLAHVAVAVNQGL